MTFKYRILHEDKYSKARLGELLTPRGVIETPAFIFCATKGAIKGGVDPFVMSSLNTQAILINTYHLMIQPGDKVVSNFGGSHKFIGWDKPIFSDSGGFQIFSLNRRSDKKEIKGSRNLSSNLVIKIEENGVIFRSHINGAKYVLTPEISIQIQKNLGSDFVFVLDECTSFDSDRAYTENSTELSIRWADRSLREFQKEKRNLELKQAIYGIVQGGIYEDLRKKSANYINENPFFGSAIGGSLGREKSEMMNIVNMTKELLRKDKPVHLLGIGKISDILQCVKYGIDTFDCVHPTRIARHGSALVNPEVNDNYYKEHINLLNSRYKLDNNPIDLECDCSTCKRFTRGYIHHLLKSKESLAYVLITVHNIFFMNNLMKEIRESIKSNRIHDIESKWRPISSYY